MAKDFIHWTGPNKANGIYRETSTGRYYSVISDLYDLSFASLEAIEDWIKNTYYGKGGLINESNIR